MTHFRQCARFEMRLNLFIVIQFRVTFHVAVSANQSYDLTQTFGLLLQLLVLVNKEAELGDADNCLLPGSGFKIVS